MTIVATPRVVVDIDRQLVEPQHTTILDDPAPYTYLVEDILNRRVIGELPLHAVTYDDYLRRPGSLKGSLPLDAADPQMIDPGRWAIYAQRGTSIEWGGRLQTASVALGAETVDVTAEGWLGYWDHRDIWTDRQFAATDQFTIFAALVADAQDVMLAGPGADLGITVTWDALSGVLRDRLQEYRAFSGKNLGQALRDLGALIGGFDYAMEYAIVGDQIVKTIRLFHPTKGTDRGHLFEYQRGARTNILRRGLTVDASNMAWRIRGWGAGADTSRLLSEQTTEARRGVYPITDTQANLSSVVEQGTLADGTAAQLARSDHPTVLPTIEVDPDLDPVWGTYGTGDTVHVRIDDGYASTDAAHRILGYKMDADRDRPTLLLEAV
jgi:hypothetical protein